jgi:four helix bundle protein
MAGVSRHEDLICWQLADEVRMRVAAIVVQPHVAQDDEFCSQIREATRSMPALIAEGFARRGRKEFVRYLRMALGELGETRDRLRDGAQSGYMSVDAFRELWRLCYRISRACSALIAYHLKKIEEDQNKKRRRKPSKPNMRHLT